MKTKAEEAVQGKQECVGCKREQIQNERGVCFFFLLELVLLSLLSHLRPPFHPFFFLYLRISSRNLSTPTTSILPFLLARSLSSSVLYPQSTR